MKAVVEASDVACRYGRHEAVHGVTFAVEPGTIFALIGPNGAGKTTTIRVLMNILRPSRGTAVVLGVDSRRLGPRELETIGYVSENQELPAWMTVAQLLAYCRAFYPTWDEALCRKLVADFDLPVDVRIARLSRGMRVKAALVSALAYRPRLLVLDEPFSGLDPVVRDDLVHGVLERAGEEQWSALVSSHDLDELERLVDVVGFLDAGRLVVSEPLTSLQARCRRIDITVDGDAGAPAPGPHPPAWIGMTTAGRVTRFVDTAYAAGESERRVQAWMPGARIEIHPMTLRDIFVALVRDARAGSRRGVQ